MEREPQWIILWVALVPFFITQFANSELHEPVGRDITNDKNPDFISIDCGSDRDYMDEETEIWYQTDKDFVETGMNHKVSPDTNLDYPYFGKQLKTLRSFPEGVRNCYTLKPKQGKNHHYLIRAIFAYGNYDYKNQTPTFDVYIGVNYWETVSIDSKYYIPEVIHTPSTDTIHVCLVKTGPTVPCISSLELRLLSDSIYQIMSNSTPQPLLGLQGRIDVGSRQYPHHRRYKDDIYDRIWRFDGYNDTNSWRAMNESIDIDPANNDDAYKLPSEVLSTAAQSLNVSGTLEFDYNSVFKDLDEDFEYYVYFHITEVDQVNKILNITLNSKSEYLKPVTIGPQIATQGNVKFSIRAISGSDAPPILNAFEIYRLITNVVSETDAQDVGGILDIKSAYRISRLKWQGDPCLPSLYAWDDLNCSSHIIPRITSL